MINYIRKIIRRILNKRKHSNEYFIKKYLKNGQIPWTEGYIQYKEKEIKNILNHLSVFNIKDLPLNYGFRIDERIIEYPWVFSKISDKETKLLDAGSVLNYNFIINQSILKNKELYIQTFYPEDNCFFKKRISYIYSDLRDAPFKNEFFGEIVCISTIEHIDMDNSIYGYDIERQTDTSKKSYEYLKVIDELMRILEKKGKLLLTFPFGKFENHGFFQQFDEEMLNRILFKLNNKGKFKIDFYKYFKNEWIYSNLTDCKDAISYNPHTGEGKGIDGAAHSRAICCIEFDKY